MERVRMLELEVMQVLFSLVILRFGTEPLTALGYGGYGFTSRLWGLTLDVIESIELVLANGTITTASKELNSDLFWVLCTSISFLVRYSTPLCRPCEGQLAPLELPPRLP